MAHQRIPNVFLLIMFLLASSLLSQNQDVMAFSPSTFIKNSVTAATTKSSSVFFAPMESEVMENEGLVQRIDTIRENCKKEWINRSVNYYSKVSSSRKDGKTRRIEIEKKKKNDISTNDISTNDIGNGQYTDNSISATDTKDEVDTKLALKHYFALQKVKDGKFHHAEQIYRKIISDLASDDECDNSKLAVTTLLLALHLQRTGEVKKTRSVFLEFFRRVAIAEQEEEEEHHECSCSGKVLQAYALFEMKNGNELKALEIVMKAIEFDKTIKPVLRWKQFRNAKRKKTNFKRKKRNIKQKKEWHHNSIDYYSKVMHSKYNEVDVDLAKKHYFALRKIKNGNLHHAEQIYSKIVNELSQKVIDGGRGGQSIDDDRAKFAITTLLLALIKQRLSDTVGARSVYLNFFRTAVVNNNNKSKEEEDDDDNNTVYCACSAKVLQAYSLFELRNGHKKKAYEIVKEAVKFDKKRVGHVLEWKQFRDVDKNNDNATHEKANER